MKIKPIRGTCLLSCWFAGAVFAFPVVSVALPPPSIFSTQSSAAILGRGKAARTTPLSAENLDGADQPINMNHNSTPPISDGDNNNRASHIPDVIPRHNSTFISSPRTRSTVYMGLAMSLHFGGYEFLRNACLSLLTSKSLQLPAVTYPLANGLVSPFSVLLLYGYGRQLQSVGPRGALSRTTAACVLYIAAVTVGLALCTALEAPLLIQQILVVVTFLFQSSYQYLLYTQQWSFVSSVLTPQEGARWFPALAGCSSLVCTLTGLLVPYVSNAGGLLGLLFMTAVPLLGTLVASDAAYAVAQRHGFDPSPPSRAKTPLGQTAVNLFRRVPTLRLLLTEVLSFQSLNTILSVALVAALPRHIPNDLERSAFTGRMYATINGVSALLQFAVLPTVMKFMEPIFLWRVMPIMCVLLCGAVSTTNMSLGWIATAFATTKVLDYAVRNVIYVMVYQPLDYESRYLGKEIIGVVGSRFGKSGMSWLLSGLSLLSGGFTTSPEFLAKLSFWGSTVWGVSAWRLSNMLPRQMEAQAMVEERQGRRDGDASMREETQVNDEPTEKKD